MRHLAAVAAIYHVRVVGRSVRTADGRARITYRLLGGSIDARRTIADALSSGDAREHHASHNATSSSLVYVIGA